MLIESDIEKFGFIFYLNILLLNMKILQFEEIVEIFIKVYYSL